MNLWHDITPGKKCPEEINVIIETPRGSHNKYEIDKDTGLIKLDRANYNAAPYPFEYGFVPQTYWDDGDALDVMLLSTYPLMPGILVNARPVALMEMTDSGESDWKILATPVNDQRWEDVQDLKDINQHNLKEYKLFFETIKQLKEKPAVVVVHGFKPRAEALEAIRKSIELYKQKFAK
ncbi:MAG: inorganic diphosphatase [bacterium]|nr:inorganic diphosphatase [bacterium]